MRTPFEPDFVRSDEEKARLIGEAGTRSDHKGHDVVCVYEHTCVDVEPSGLGNTHRNRLVKILTEKGASEHNVLRFDYDPQSTLIRLPSLRVHRQGGAVEEVDTSRFVDRQQPQRSMFWAPRMKVFTLPRLEPGDAVEYTYYSKGFTVAYLGAEADGGPGGASPHDPREEDIVPPMEGVFYEVFVFEETVPVKHKKYSVSLAARTPLHFGVYNGECLARSVFDDQRVTYSFEKKDMEGYKTEPRMGAPEEVLTKVVLTTLGSWEEKSRWFFEANEGQFDADEAVQAKVNEITEGLETLEEKARALNHWVAQNIRYIGYCVAKGEGYTIHPGTMIFHERGGVCKESAGMLVTMCRAAGLTSYAALTQSGARVESIPADQFNHCVTAVRREDGSYLMLDPTWAVFSTEMFCSAEQEQNYLIGSPEGETLMATPYSPPEKSPLDLRLETRLSAEGDLEGSLTLTAGGRSDTNLRRVFGLGPRENVEPFLRKILSSLSAETELASFSHSDPRDFGASVEVTMQFRAPRYATVSEAGLAFPLPSARLLRSPLLVRHLDLAKTEERKHEMMIWYTQKASAEETLALPDGYVPAHKPFRTSVSSPVASFEADVQGAPGRMEARASVSFHNRHVPADQYKSFKKSADEVGALAGRFWTAEKKS